MRRLFLLLLMVTGCYASTWYVAPSASALGDGTLDNPWQLSVSLTNAAVSPGDTIFLRGGNYFDGGFYSTLAGSVGSYITVKSYGDEWARVIGGKHGILVGDLSDQANDTLIDAIDGGDHWYVGMEIIIDSEMLQLNSRSENTWLAVRGWGGTTISAHSEGVAVIPRAMVIQHTGSYTSFENFEITSLGSTNRIVGVANYVGGGLNLSSAGIGNKAIGLLIHNVGHPGIGFWYQQNGGEINGCIIWGCGIYDFEGTWVRGGGIYAQNNAGIARIANNILFRNLRAGCSMYGTTALVSGLLFDHNCSFAPGTPDANAIQLMSDSSRMTNNLIGTNVVMGSLGLGYSSISNVEQSIIGNVIVNAGLQTEEFISGTVSNNTFLMPWGETDNHSIKFSANSSANKSELNMVWNYNTYYFSNLIDHPYQFSYNTKDIAGLTDIGGGMLKFDNDNGKSWREYSGFDSNSSYNTNWPGDYLYISSNQLTYNTNRFYVYVVNTTTNTEISLDLETLGFALGERWSLRDAQNYFTVVSSGTYSGSTISLPLTLTNVAEIPGITNYVNKHTNIDQPGLFNAFILTRSSGITTKSIGTATIGKGTIQ